MEEFHQAGDELLPEPELDLENLYAFIQVPSVSGELRSFCTNDDNLHAELDDEGTVHLGPFIIVERQRHISAVSAVDRHISSLEREHEEHCDMLRELYLGACNELHYSQEQIQIVHPPEHGSRVVHSSRVAQGTLGRFFGTWHALSVLARSQRQELSMRERWIEQRQRHRRHASVATVFAAWRFCVVLGRAERAHKATLDQQAVETLAQHRALMDSVAEAEVRHREMLELQMEVMQHAQTQSARAVALAAYPPSNVSESDASIEVMDVQSVDSSPTSDNHQQQVPLSNSDRQKYLARIRVLTDELRLDQEAHALELEQVRADYDRQVASLKADLERVQAHGADKIAQLSAQLDLERARVADGKTSGGENRTQQQHVTGVEENSELSLSQAAQNSTPTADSLHHAELQLVPTVAAVSGSTLHSSSAPCGDYESADQERVDGAVEEQLRRLLQGMEAWEVAEKVTQALAPEHSQRLAGIETHADTAGNPPAVTISYHVSLPSDDLTILPPSHPAHIEPFQEGRGAGDQPAISAKNSTVPKLDPMALHQVIPGWMRRPRELLRLDDAEMCRVICALQDDDARTIFAEQSLSPPPEDASLEVLHAQLLLHFGCEEHAGAMLKLIHQHEGHADGEAVGQVAEEEEEEEETPRSAAATARLQRLLAMEPHDGEVLILSPLSTEGVAGIAKKPGEDGRGTGIMSDDEESPLSRRSPLAEQRRLALLSTADSDEVHEVVLINPALERLSSAEISAASPSSVATEGGGAGGNDGGERGNSEEDSQPAAEIPSPPTSAEEDWLSDSGSD